MTDDQAETNRYWGAIIEAGGREGRCGWCQDRWGFSWQIVLPAVIAVMKHEDPAAAKRAASALMTMNCIEIDAIIVACAGW